MQKKAFSLIELSIAIIVISVVIVGIVSVSTVSKINSNVKITNDRITRINQALGEFVRVNKRLPCPASIKAIKVTDTTYGTEGTAAGTCTAGTGVYLSTATGATKMVYGMVPTKTIGLSSEYGEDSFGNKIAYIVDNDYTSSTTFATATTGIIGQKYVNNSLITDVSNAIYALVSYGANQSSAFPAKASTQNTVTSDADEMYNDAITFNDGAKTADFTQILVKSTTRSTVFDDIVYYRSRDDFLKDNNASNIVDGNITSSANITSPCTTTGGGSTTTSGTTVHTFTSSGTLVCTNAKTANILVVGGGGSGGAHRGVNAGTGGGGGGGVIYAPGVSLTVTTYTITVAGTTSGKTESGSSCGGIGTNGSTSSFSGNGYTVTANGGGGGGGCNTASGNVGGSGGGGHCSGNGGSASVGTVTGIATYSLFGNAGGNSSGGCGVGGGGGGGASSGGTSVSSSTNGGAGGEGYSTDISGTTAVYGSGGGGQGVNGGVGGTNAGTGSSGTSTSRTGLDGTANTGGGGGGNSVSDVRSGDGGSGVVIISY
ncbi:MAG: prepilin-type N-terminal cleavage/methylation domain-containing protein [Pseudomonadota bacterium]